MLRPFTVAGLFDRLDQYHKQHPTSPACDTQVMVKLNGDWAFPRRIIEEWADDCPADAPAPWLVVTGFATLTPMPTRNPTATATAVPTATSAPTATPRPSFTAPVRRSLTATMPPTRTPDTEANRLNLPILGIALTAVGITAVTLFLWKGKN